MMKNITLAIQDDVLETLRVVAAEEKTTVNAMVREFLTNKAKQRNKRNEARATFKELALNSKANLGRHYIWNREDAYVDRMLPRHEHIDIRSDGKAR